MCPPRSQLHCATCNYRHAAGQLTIQSDDAARTEPSCWTCAREAADLHAAEPTHRVRFEPEPEA